jgi:hypothetical protein
MLIAATICLFLIVITVASLRFAENLMLLQTPALQAHITKKLEEDKQKSSPKLVLFGEKFPVYENVGFYSKCPLCTFSNGIPGGSIPDGNYCYQHRASGKPKSQLLDKWGRDKNVFQGPSSPRAIFVGNNNEEMLYQFCSYCGGEWVVKKRN